jgi:hypothetical protein
MTLREVTRTVISLVENASGCLVAQGIGSGLALPHFNPLAFLAPSTLVIQMQILQHLKLQD